MKKIIEFEKWEIMENRIGWLHQWEITPDELEDAIQDYEQILFVGDSEMIFEINFLTSFQELKELAKRRIEEFEESYFDDEFFSVFEKDYISNLLKDIDECNDREKLNQIFHWFEMESGMLLSTYFPKSAFVHLYESLEMNIWDEKTGGCKYTFSLERK